MDTHTHTDNILKQASTHLKHESPPIPEQQLKQAIMKGIERGNKQKRINRHLLKWGLPTGAVAICVLLFIMVSLQPTQMRVIDNTLDTANAAINKEVPKHVLYQLSSQALQNAAKNGLYQPINQTSIQDQFTFTVDGVIADQNSATIFYTLNIEQEAPWDSLTDIAFTDDKGKPLNNTLNFLNNTEISSKTDILRGKFNISYQIGTLPSTLTLKATPTITYFESPYLFSEEEIKDKIKTGKEFEIKIPIDTSKFDKFVKEIPINKHVKTAEYDFTVVKAILRPLSTELQIKMDEPRLSIFQSFIKPKLTISNGKTYLSTKSINGSAMSIPYEEGNGLISIYFDSIYYLEHDKISFQASGIEKDFLVNPKLVVDTEKKQLISAPDKLITLENIQSNDMNNKTEIQFKITDKIDNSDRTGFIYPKDSYDANGTPLSATTSRYSLPGNSGNNSIRKLNFEFDTQNFTQPLTFELVGYYQQIPENIDVPLIPNKQ